MPLWLQQNWLPLLLAAVIIGLLLALVLVAGGLGALWRLIAGHLPQPRSFRRVYLRALGLAANQTPSLFGGDVATLEVIQAFAGMHLAIRGVAEADSAPDRPDDGLRSLERGVRFWPARVGRWWRARREPQGPASAPGRALLDAGHLVVRGGPGSGKTTLLRHLAVANARDLLGRSRHTQGETVRAIYGWPQPRMPILIALRQLARACPEWQTMPLLDAYESVASKALDLPQRPPRGWFARRWERGGCVLLVDGFDELADDAARATLAGELRRLAGVGQGNLILLTTRPVGYANELDGARGPFTLRELAPLNDAEMAAMTLARYRAYHAAEAARQRRSLGWDPERKADGLMQKLLATDHLADLARTPLMLALMITIHASQEDGELPQERYRVYEEACRLLTEKWEQRRQTEAGESGGRPASAFCSRPP